MKQAKTDKRPMAAESETSAEGSRKLTSAHGNCTRSPSDLRVDLTITLSKYCCGLRAPLPARIVHLAYLRLAGREPNGWRCPCG